MKTYSPYPSYKPSGIDWLGDIPQHWEVRKLKFLAKIRTGRTPKIENSNVDYFLDGRINWFTPSDFNQSNGKLVNSRRKINQQAIIENQVELLDENTVFLIGIGATIGKIGISTERASSNQQINSISFKQDLFPKFGYYSLLIGNIQIKFLADFTTLPILNQSKTKEIFILYPLLTEQYLIARFLDYKLAKIDRFIRKKKQLIQLLNEQKAAIINRLILKGLDNSVKMKNSEVDWIGSIPSHWKVRKTKLLFELVTEVAPPNNTEVLLSIYTQYGVKPRTEFEERGNRATTTDNYWLVKKQDIIVNKLLAWMGAIGISEYDGVTSPAYDILRSKGDANPYYYHYLFRSPVAFTEFKRHSRGIMDVRLRLYFNRFGDIKLPVPPLEEQTAIVAHIEQETAQLNALIQTIEKEIALTQEYRTALIAEAVTGKIDVRGYEVAEMEEEEDEIEMVDEVEEETEN